MKGLVAGQLSETRVRPVVSVDVVYLSFADRCLLFVSGQCNAINVRNLRVVESVGAFVCETILANQR